MSSITVYGKVDSPQYAALTVPSGASAKPGQRQSIGGSAYSFVNQPSAPAPSSGTSASQLMKPDPAQAEKLVKLGDQYFKKGDAVRGLEHYEKAMLSDPQNGDLVNLYLQTALAVREEAGKEIKKDPKSELRLFRVQIDQKVLAILSSGIGKIPKEARGNILKIMDELKKEIPIDQALGFSYNSEKFLQELSKVKDQADKYHSLPAEQKLGFLSSVRSQAQSFMVLTKVRLRNSEDQAYVKEKLTNLTLEYLDFLVKFVESDKDEAIQKLKPLYLAQQMFAQGKSHEAITDLRAVEEESLGVLGEGDKGKGDAKLSQALDQLNNLDLDKKLSDKEKAKRAQQIYQEVPFWLVGIRATLTEYEKSKSEASKIVEEGYKKLGKGNAEEGKRAFLQVKSEYDQLPKDAKRAEVEKVLKKVSEDMIEAYQFLKDHEAEQVRVAEKKNVEDKKLEEKRKAQDLYHSQLAVLEIWDSQIQARRAKELDGFWSFWNYKEIYAKANHDQDLIRDVRRRLERGEAKTVEEAIKIIKDKGAIPILDTNGNDLLDQQAIKEGAGKFISPDSEDFDIYYTRILLAHTPAADTPGHAQVFPKSESEKEILEHADSLAGDEFGQWTRLKLYDFLRTRALDAQVKKQAQSQYDVLKKS